MRPTREPEAPPAKHKLTFALKRGDFEVENIEVDDHGPMGMPSFKLTVTPTCAQNGPISIMLSKDDLAWLAECAQFWGLA